MFCEICGSQWLLTGDRGAARIQASSSGSNSAVECDLAKVEVAGSNPVSRSKSFRAKAKSPRKERSGVAFALRLIRYGGVAKW